MKNIQLKIFIIIICSSGFLSCMGLENGAQPVLNCSATAGLNRFYSVSDGSDIFIYEYMTGLDIKCTIFMLSGITGINHESELDVIKVLAADGNRVVVIHPRGTGYSDGERGDMDDFSLFIEDHVEIIKSEIEKYPETACFLFGHSMSTALAMQLQQRLVDAAHPVDGVILVNPPYLLKQAEGMSPRFTDYIRYAIYFVFAPHVPIVDMSGNPDLMKNPEEKAEAELRQSDPLIVKYFSLYMMNESRKMMNSMQDSAVLAKSPLLLIYGTEDSLVEREGCDIIFNSWNHPDKHYIEIIGGPHGKLTVLEASDIIKKWVGEHL